LLQEVAFRQREEALKRKRRDLELQESLLRFTRFLQENDAKRAKAARRAADEARLRGEREAEIAVLHAEAEACRAQRDGMQAALQKIVRCIRWWWQCSAGDSGGCDGPMCHQHLAAAAHPAAPHLTLLQEPALPSERGGGWRCLSGN
jgi:hypothetical protein